MTNLQYVVLDDGDTYSGIDGATVLTVTDADVAREFADGGYEGAKDLPESAVTHIRIDALMRVAESADAVLSSEGGALSMAGLALALKAAGIEDYTDQYADEIAVLAAEDATNG